MNDTNHQITATMRFSLLSLSTILFALATTSCVSFRKYEDMEAWKDRVQMQYDQAEQGFRQCQAETTQIREEIVAKDQQIQTLNQDLARTNQQYQELDRTNTDLMTRYDRILAQNQQMLAAASGEKAELTAQLALKEQELDRRETELRNVQTQLESQQATLVSREARVAELETAMAENEARLSAIRERVDQALRGFSEADLTVREQNGKVYVSLSQNLLFASGSRTINRQGRQAIAQLATVLNSNTDINITVEGHTDSDGDPAFNWDLSVGRAISVVSELTNNGVDPRRVIASGRGEYFPVADNASSAGKALNRRTEIILTPRLEELFELLGE